MIRISSNFDAGNIEFVGETGNGVFDVKIRKDAHSEFFQWFYFRLTGAKGQPCRMNIVNAGDASYVDGFRDYQAVISYDRENWFRTETEFDGQILSIGLTPEADAVYIAYFAPFSMDRHADLIAWTLQHPRVNYECLGSTLDGQDIDLLKVGDGDASLPSYWVIGRQHPGETMAEWWMEGFLSRLLDESDPVSRALLSSVNFYVVPNMNPDGSRRGHLRTNACGANLNREWQAPSLERSPEVFYVLQKMKQTGVDFCLDVHGDEALPYNFIAGPEGTPSWTAERQEHLQFFKQTLMSFNPDFQIAKGYPPSSKGKANLTVCTNYIAETFGCLAMTLEMPFKDTLENPEPVYGWSPERCQRLAESNIDVMHQFYLRFHQKSL